MSKSIEKDSLAVAGCRTAREYKQKERKNIREVVKAFRKTLLETGYTPGNEELTNAWAAVK